jgi:large subunit ribosomal protein L33
MASNREKIRLVLEETGEFYTTTINARKMATEGKGKLELKKYSKKLKKHMVFKQKKIK